MAKGLDELIEYLLEEIALTGSRGKYIDLPSEFWQPWQATVEHAFFDPALTHFP